jgi:hypothetical protein
LSSILSPLGLEARQELVCSIPGGGMSCMHPTLRGANPKITKHLRYRNLRLDSLLPARNALCMFSMLFQLNELHPDLFIVMQCPGGCCDTGDNVRITAVRFRDGILILSCELVRGTQQVFATRFFSLSHATHRSCPRCCPEIAQTCVRFP